MKIISRERAKSSKEILEEIDQIERRISGTRHRLDRMTIEMKNELERHRRHRLIVWGSHLEYLLCRMCPFTKEQMECLTDEDCKAILNEVFFDQTVSRVFTEKVCERLAVCGSVDAPDGADDQPSLAYPTEG